MDHEGKIFVVPGFEGAVVRDPKTLLKLKPEGEWKPRNSYWLRRVLFKDVMAPKDRKKARPTPKKAKAKE